MAKKLSLVLIMGFALAASTLSAQGTLFVEGDNVGIGTATPLSRLHLISGTLIIGGHSTGERSGTPVDFQISGLRNVIYNIDSDNNSTNGSFSVSRDGSVNAVLFVTREDGLTGINRQFPNFPLQVGTGPTNGNGAHVTPEGVWTNSSSRSGKENVRTLTEEDAKQALAGLEPVRYTGKGSATGEEYVGFIAEDVPDLVAMVDRSSLSPMDIVAVLTRVVQAQQSSLDEQIAINAELEQRLRALEEDLAMRPLKGHPTADSM